MKKILHIIGGMDRAGAETFLRNILLAMPRKKYSFGILTFLPPQNGKKYAYQDELEERGVTFYHINDTRFTRPLFFKKQIAKIVRENNYKIVHSHNDFMSAFLLSGAKNGGATTLISHAHSTSNARINSLPKRLISEYLKKRLRRISHIKLACGQSAGECLYGTKNSFIVIPNGISLQNYAFSTKAREELRKKYGLENDSLVLLNIGRLEPVKNQSFLVDVFDKLAAKDKKVTLFIVGDGSLKSALQSRIKASKYASRIHLLSAQSNTSGFYSMADIFLLPSVFEGLPMVSVEAQASGLPCIFSTDVSKDADIKNNALFVPTDDPELWAKAVLSVKINNKARGEAWKSKDISSFDSSESARRLEKVYDSVKDS